MYELESERKVQGQQACREIGPNNIMFLLALFCCLVFAPLKPVRITMEYSSSGKATGEADVHFDTHEDAVAAMLKDRSPCS